MLFGLGINIVSGYYVLRQYFTEEVIRRINDKVAEIMEFAKGEADKLNMVNEIINSGMWEMYFDSVSGNIKEIASTLNHMSEIINDMVEKTVGINDNIASQGAAMEEINASTALSN